MRIERRPAELAAAALTGALGIAAVWGSSELGAAWTTSGPEPGYFPFYVGLILIAASLGNAVAALRARPAEETWLTPDQSRRLIGFLIPLVVYVAATVWLGPYVASAAYAAFDARFRGGYRVLRRWRSGSRFRRCCMRCSSWPSRFRC